MGGIIMATINANGTMVFGNASGGSVTIAPKNNTSTNYTLTIPDVGGSVAMGESIGRRNYLINGNFDKWDYATSQTSSGYGSDNRWNNGHNGSTKTHSQVACGDTERALFNAMYYSRTQVSSVAGSGNFVHKWQAIENVNLLAGKTVTLSFWGKADTNKNIVIEFWQRFGTGGSPSQQINNIGSQLVSLTTTWQKKTITVTLPSIIGTTLGTDGVQTTCSGVTFWFDAGSSFTQASGLGQQSGTFDIAQVKIEDGSIATNGWHPYDGEFGGEIEACQRYYEIAEFIFSNSPNTQYATLNYKVTKRVAPTITATIQSGSGQPSYTVASNGSSVNTIYQSSAPSATGTSLITLSAEL
jgi:hypothetical protein